MGSCYYSRAVVRDTGFGNIGYFCRKYRAKWGVQMAGMIFQTRFGKGNWMKKVKITVMRTAHYADLIEKYENPIGHACDMQEGQVFVANGWQKPEGFCDSAWESISAFVMTLSHGGENFYDGWMKNKKSAMISCNDGFRPVSFLLETMEE